MRLTKQHLLISCLAGFALAIVIALSLPRTPDATVSSSSSGQSQKPVAPPDTSGNATNVPNDLASMLAEPDEVVRLNLLAGWCERHTLDEIYSAWLATVGGYAPGHIDFADHPLLKLAYIKLADLHPDATPEELMRLQHTLMVQNVQFAPTTAYARFHLLATNDPALAIQEIMAARMPEEERRPLLTQSLENLARIDPKKALEFIRANRRLPRQAANDAIARGWAKTDPKAAFEWGVTHLSSQSHDSSLRIIVETWSHADPEATIAAVLPLLPCRALDDSLGRLLQNWMTTSPDASKDWIQKQPSLPAPVLHAAINALASTHPQLAVSLLSRPMSDHVRTEHAETIAWRWSQNDPYSARQWLNTLPPDRTFLAAANAIASNLARHSSSEAMAFYNSLPPDIDRSQIITSLAANLNDPQFTFRWLLAMPRPPPSSAIGAVIGKMSAEQAERLISAVPEGRLRDSAYASLGATQYHHDRANFTRWLRSLPDSATQAAVLKGNNVYYWSQSKPEELVSFANSLTSGPALDILVRPASEYLIQQNPAKAIDWLLDRQASPQAPSQLQRAFETLAHNSAEAALPRLQAIPAGAPHTFALEGLVRGLMKTAPDSAADILLSEGSVEEQKKTVHTLTYEWARTDADAAAAWTRALPSGEVRDHALKYLSLSLSETNPELGLTLRPLVQGDEMRHDVTRYALRGIQKKDDRLAQVTLDRMTLSPTERKRLQEELDGYR